MPMHGMGSMLTHSMQQMLSKLIGNEESKPSTKTNKKQEDLNSSHGEFTTNLDQENNKLERTG